MNLPDNITEYLKHIVRCIKETMPVTAIYLFGSYATGNYHENSDLDIYIITSDRSKKLFDLAVEVDTKIGMPRKIAIDILVNYEDDFKERINHFYSIEQQIMKKGIQL